MKVYVHQLTITVVTLDHNPASVATTIDARLHDLQTDHPLGRILTTNTDATQATTHHATIPDEPTPQQGTREHDDWCNHYLYEVMREATHPERPREFLKAGGQ